MLSLSPGGMSAAHASGYFSREDYYLRGAEPSQWLGKGGETLGLKGEVREEDFRRLAEGKAPDGSQLVAPKITRGKAGDQLQSHRAGNDLTFSAPKSVSVGYAAGNRELKEIWDRAVVNTMGHIEGHYSQYRTRDGVKSSGNMVAAKFDHVTSRALDPEVHSHVFLLNMTRVPGAGGKWKANEPKNIYTDKISLGMLARQEAMHLYHLAGYQTYFTNRGQLLFEIGGVDPRELETFSKRSATIAKKVAQWKEEKRFPGVSESVMKQMAALDTRDPKRAVTREDVRREWDRGFESAGTTAQKVLERIEARRHLRRGEPALAAAEPGPGPGAFRHLPPGAYPRTLASVQRHAKVPELTRQPGYEAAKRGADLNAARRVVAALVQPEVVNEIARRLPDNAALYVVPVANQEGHRLNLLPAAYAERLARDLGGTVWNEIAKVAGGQNTGAAVDERLHNRQEFRGALPPQGSAIVIVDDTFTVGGTLAALVDHLAREGNTPVCATTLAAGRYGEDLTPTREQIKGLLDKTGVDARQFEAELGYPPDALTGAEIRCYLRNGARGIDGARARFFASEAEAAPALGDSRHPPLAADSGAKSSGFVVQLASDFITNQEAVFDRAELLKVAAQVSGGGHSLAELNAAVDGWAGRRNGIDRMGQEARGRQAGREFYSTRKMRALEARNLESLKKLGDFRSVTSRSEVKAYLARLAREENVVLSAGQQRHIVNELAGAGGFCVTQGDPGTGKTFSAQIIERFNREVLEPSGRSHHTLNLAYTGKAALEMANANGKPAYTIDSFLNSFYQGKIRHDFPGQLAPRLPGREPPAGRSPEVQVVLKIDEASLVGARQAEHLLQVLEEIKERGVPAKLGVIGDRKQLPGIQASPFFCHASALAQEGRGDYAELKEISRQKNATLREVAELLNREDRAGLGANAQQAIGMLASQGRVQEISERKELLEAAVSHYLGESSRPSPDPAKAAAGGQQSVLMVTPLNRDREELNAGVRGARLAAGQLGPGTQFAVLTPVRQDLTVASFAPGMTLVFSGERGEDGRMHPVPGSYLNQAGEVQGTDPEKNTVTVRLGGRGPGAEEEAPRQGKPKNITKTFDAARLAGQTTLCRRELREFAPGERIVFGRNLCYGRVVSSEAGKGVKGRGIRNGEMGEIEKITSSGGHSAALVRMDDGRKINLQLDRYGPQQIDYGYAVTIYKGQGGTVDSVIPFHYLKPGLENEQKALESLAGLKMAAPQFRQWNTTLTEYEKGYGTGVEFGGHRGELGFMMIREKSSRQEHKGVAIRFHNGLALYADEGTRLRMRDAGMYWSPDQRSWVAALTNDRAMRLMDRHPLKDPEYLRQVKSERVPEPAGRVTVERNFQAEIDARGEAEQFGRASYNAFNVAVTRARHAAMVFTNSLAGLKQAVLSVDEKSSTIGNKLLPGIERSTGALKDRAGNLPAVVRQQVREPELKLALKVPQGSELER